IQTIVENFQIPKIEPDEKLRAKLTKQSKKKLFAQLKKLDLESAEKIGLNQRKLIRALEVCLKTDKKFSELTKKGKSLFDVLQIGIKHPRKELYRRINLRAQKMLDEGLIEEVESIVSKLKKKMPVRKIWQLPSMSGIGYKQIGMYLRKEVDLDEAVRLLARDTRHYAKRQIAWFKRDRRIKWVKTKKEAERLVKNHLSG
ncbi:MAG: tRNA dimethylallyltransferase, partial [Patescibacteria group bacterium]|nr:tRNA dimethylallyltransferase [Patescibacteria group bacterium]